MELTEENVMKVLEDLIPYIEADGGWLEFVGIEEETNIVKVRLGGACSTCAMSAYEAIEHSKEDVPELQVHPHFIDYCNNDEVDNISRFMEAGIPMRH